MINHDIVIVGGGPAGMAAAVAAYDAGVTSVAILEREPDIGGILRQCIHNGFGLHEFKEQLAGPEYAQRFVDKFNELGIEYKANMLPTDKYESLENLKNNNSYKIAFVGDGINDAASIRLSDVGIAMGDTASDATISISDIVIMTNDLNKLVELQYIAKKTRNKVLENIADFINCNKTIWALSTACESINSIL